MKKIIIPILLLLFLMPAVLAAEIEIIFPQDGTYGPWSTTYQDYKDGKAHFLNPVLEINQDAIDSYEFYDNGNLIARYDATDLEPNTAIITQPGLHTITVKGYNNEELVEEQSVEANFVFDYFDTVESVNELPPVFISNQVEADDFAQIDATLEEYEKTQEHVQIEKSFVHMTVKDKYTGEEKENTLIIIKLKFDPKVESLQVYELIPKEVAEHVNKLILNGNFTIIDPDPLLVWNFATTDLPPSGELEIEYAVDDFVIEEDLEHVKSIPVAQIKPQKQYLYYLVPIILIPFIVFIFIYFSKFEKEE